jgi:hypothetical protein
VATQINQKRHTVAAWQHKFVENGQDIPVMKEFSAFSVVNECAAVSSLSFFGKNLSLQYLRFLVEQMCWIFWRMLSRKPGHAFLSNDFLNSRMLSRKPSHAFFSTIF